MIFLLYGALSLLILHETESISSGVWSDWENLGGYLASGPTAASWGENRLDVFVSGEDEALWHKWWDGRSWSVWERVRDGPISEPDCASWGLNRIDCFVLKKDTEDVLHTYWEGYGWSGWENLGGDPISGPTAAAVDVDHLRVFARFRDNKMHQRYWNRNS